MEHVTCQHQPPRPVSADAQVVTRESSPRQDSFFFDFRIGLYKHVEVYVWKVAFIRVYQINTDGSIALQHEARATEPAVQRTPAFWRDMPVAVWSHYVAFEGVGRWVFKDIFQPIMNAFYIVEIKRHAPNEMHGLESRAPFERWPHVPNGGWLSEL